MTQKTIDFINRFPSNSNINLETLELITKDNRKLFRFKKIQINKKKYQDQRIDQMIDQLEKTLEKQNYSLMGE